MIPASSTFGVLAPGEPSVFPYIFPDENILDFNFFEAACLRQVGNKFVLVYSGFSGPDYSLLTFDADGILYVLSCRYDINTLIGLGEAIL